MRLNARAEVTLLEAVQAGSGRTWYSDIYTMDTPVQSNADDVVMLSYFPFSTRSLLFCHQHLITLPSA